MSNFPVDREYNRVLADVLYRGVPKRDRTGTGTLSTFGQQARYSLKGGSIPLITSRKVFCRSFIHETLWFLSGSTDIEYLKTNNVSIWDSWVKEGTARYDESGNLIGGSIGTGAYGSQWRSWDDTRVIPATEANSYFERGFDYIGEVAHSDMTIVQRKIDQIANVVNLLLNNPDSRRILVVAYNPAMVEDCVLPPCHSFVQFWTRELSIEERLELVMEGEEIGEGWSSREVMDILDTYKIPRRALSCHLYCRSQDYPVGSVFNIPQYALLTHMIAQVVNMEAEELIWTGGDVHAYTDQVHIAKEQLEMEVFENTAKVKLNSMIGNIDAFTFDDIEIVDYQHGPVVKYPVAV